MNELDIINGFLRPIARHKAAVGLLDDCAHLPCPKNMLISSDALIEGVHYPANSTGEQIANRLLSVNCTDIFASGGQPAYYQLSLYCPGQYGVAFWQSFSKTLNLWQKRHKVFLLGGNFTSAGANNTQHERAQFHVTMFGPLLSRRPLLRQSAQLGDYLVHTGLIGGAHFGLLHLLGKISLPPAMAKHAVKEFYNPAIYWPFYKAILHENLCHAAIDISDGIALDAERLANASGLLLQCDWEKINLNPICTHKNHHITRQTLLRAGDDYQLLWALPAKKLKKFAQICANFKVPMAVFGRFYARNTNIANQPTIGEHLGYIHG